MNTLEIDKLVTAFWCLVRENWSSGQQRSCGSDSIISHWNSAQMQHAWDLCVRLRNTSFGAALAMPVHCSQAAYGLHRWPPDRLQSWYMRHNRSTRYEMAFGYLPQESPCVPKMKQWGLTPVYRSWTYDRVDLWPMLEEV